MYLDITSTKRNYRKQWTLPITCSYIRYVIPSNVLGQEPFLNSDSMKKPSDTAAFKIMFSCC